VLAVPTGSTTWVIVGVCFVIFSDEQLWRWYTYPRIKRDPHG
jgi:steroid 5-alpha reductase family enzyme